MSDTQKTQEPQAAVRPDWAQYIVCAVMVIVGAFLIYDGVSLPGGYAKVDPVGPTALPDRRSASDCWRWRWSSPIAIPRGLQGEADAGEDIDPDMPSDWRTVGLLVALFVAADRARRAARLGDHQRPVLRRLRNGAGQQALRPQHR